TSSRAREGRALESSVYGNPDRRLKRGRSARTRRGVGQNGRRARRTGTDRGEIGMSQPARSGSIRQARGIERIARSQGLLLAWSVSFVIALVIAILSPIGQRWEWFAAGAGIAVLLAFVVQIIIGRVDGFILRTATSVLGCVLIVGIVSFVGALLTAVSAGISLFPAEFAAS